MSPFEIVMLVCFGAAWPFSIRKSWLSRRTTGKSVFFLFIVLVGYGAGILNKVFYHFDAVVWMYGLNATMVAIDIALWFRNRAFERRYPESGPPDAKKARILAPERTARRA